MVHVLFWFGFGHQWIDMSCFLILKREIEGVREKTKIPSRTWKMSGLNGCYGEGPTVVI